MLLSTNTNGLLNHFSEEKSIELIKNAGFDAYDFTFFGSKMQNSRVFDDDYLEYAEGFRVKTDGLQQMGVQDVAGEEHHNHKRCYDEHCDYV